MHCNQCTRRLILSQAVAHPASLAVPVRFEVGAADLDSQCKTSGSNSSPMKHYQCPDNSLAGQKDTDRVEEIAYPRVLAHSNENGTACTEEMGSDGVRIETKGHECSGLGKVFASSANK